MEDLESRVLDLTAGDSYYIRVLCQGLRNIIQGSPSNLAQFEKEFEYYLGDKEFEYYSGNTVKLVEKEKSQ